MEIGYVFLNLKPEDRLKVVKNLREIPSVKEARLVIGVFDAVVKIEDKTVEDVERVYFNDLSKVPGIISSRLHIVACPRTRK